VKIFIDFDDVIFNTKRFRADFEKVFSQFGITADIFRKNYYNYSPNKKSFSAKTYFLEKHLAVIRKHVILTSRNLKKVSKLF